MIYASLNIIGARKEVARQEDNCSACKMKQTSPYEVYGKLSEANFQS
jgi:hypothetical protein